MTVFDIVRLVDPGHIGSAPVGRTWQDVRDSRDDADRVAECWNSHRAVESLRYAVEEHDESSPNRAPLE